VKIRSSAGKVHEYVRLVESVRVQGKPRQVVVATLGRRDILEPLLPQLVRFLKGEKGVAEFLPAEGPLEPLEASTWGPALLTRSLFEELGLWAILDGARPSRGRAVAGFADRVQVLVASRLTRPSSEHGLARWLETDYVCDRRGRRFLPVWKTTNRVKVDFAQLQRWYRTLDQLLEIKPHMERGLYGRLRDLFSLNPDLVFFDITSLYFEGDGPPGFALNGHSRDGKPRNHQVLLGMVMVGGWPIAHYVFQGNRRDSTTVPEVLGDLMKRFHFGRIIFVGDRGMVTTKNLDLLRKEGQGYIVGLSRRRRPEIQVLLDRATGAWIDCPVGITAGEKHPPPKTRVQEVLSDEPGVRVFVVDSEERAAFERERREKSMERTRRALERLAMRVAKGALRKPEKIGAAAARILSRNHGHRYYDWTLQGETFRFFEHPVNLEREKKYEGKYLIQTEEKDLSPLQAVERYKELSEVERGFRHIKDPFGIRPLYHQKKERVQAHICVAALAFLLDRFLERRLKDAGVDLSSIEALQALETVRRISFRINGETRTGVTPGSPRARQVLAALGIRDRHPPDPPIGQETRV
jgi:transposase